MKLEKIVEGFKKLETMEVSGFAGESQTMDPQIKPVGSGMKVVGSALTLKGKIVSKSVINMIKPGEVLLIDPEGDHKTGVWGHLLTIDIMYKGASGVVVDGAIFHARHLRELGFPVFSRTISAYAGASRLEAEANKPVKCGGVMVNAGDIIMGDDDGVVVIPQDKAEEVLFRAQISHEAHSWAREEMLTKHTKYTDLPHLKEQVEEKGKLPREKTYVAFLHWLQKVKKDEYEEYIAWLKQIGEKLEIEKNG